MPYILIEDFRYGQDTRKSDITAPPGTLRSLKNAHISRGGEIEKRKAFVSKFSLPAGTKGMAAQVADLYVFGSGAAPGGMPSGVNYQRLDHPDSSSSLSKILSTEIFDGKLYVIAEYANGDVFHFYNGSIIKDWGAGLVRLGMTNNNGIAAHLASLITDTKFSVVNSTNKVTITAVNAGTAFSISASATNGGASNDQTATVTIPTPNVAGTSEVLSSAAFNITGGSANIAATGSVTLTGGASGNVSSITVNGIEILGATVNYATSLNNTASLIAAQINTYNSSPEYTATANGAVVTISAAQSAGADPNGFVVACTAATITTSTVNMASGVTNAITSVKVDGIEVLNVRINWTSSNSTVAANAAAQINTYTSSPDYTATAASSTVTVRGASGSGATPNGKSLTVTTVGNVTVTGSGSTMAGGIDAVTGQAQVSEVAVGGTFEAGDQFTITLDGYPYGYTSRPSAKGKIVRTLKSKVYSAVGSLMHFCGLNAPTRWSSSDTGAGFINMSNQASGSEEIKGLESYFDNIAVFAKRAVQIWYMDADPEKNRQIQVLKGTGTIAGKSVLGFGDGDILYLENKGIRSIKARDASNLAMVSEIGTAIDNDVTSYLSGLTTTQKEAAVAAVEPVDNRYMLSVYQKMYVFSYFSNSKVTAWSEYDTGLEITDFATIDTKLYARAGDTIYLYGGDNGNTYDTSQAVAVIPFLDAKAPATTKDIYAIDVALQGLWKVEIASEPDMPDSYDTVANLASQSYTKHQIPVSIRSSHFKIRMTNSTAEYARIGNMAIHYNGNEAD